MATYTHTLLDLWKVDVLADTDFGSFDPGESEGTLYFAAVVDAAVCLTIRVYRGAEHVDLCLNSGNPLIPGALFQSELNGVIVPLESCALRVSGACTVDKLVVVETK